jgi:hypothetical protein
MSPMNPAVRGFPMWPQTILLGPKVRRCLLVFCQLGAYKPSISHSVPCNLALAVECGFGRLLAVNGVFPKFRGPVHRLISAQSRYLKQSVQARATSSCDLAIVLRLFSLSFSWTHSNLIHVPSTRTSRLVFGSMPRCK